MIFLGPFYLINLVLAVVSLSYEQETAALQDEVLRVSGRSTTGGVVLVFEMFSMGQNKESKKWLMEIAVASPEHFFPLVSKQKKKKECHSTLNGKTRASSRRG